MKRVTIVAVVMSVLVLFLAPLWAAPSAAKRETGNRFPGAPVAATLSTVTGMAISPLLGAGGYGAYQYFRTTPERRAALPWFAQTTFFVPALLLVGLCAAKD